VQVNLARDLRRRVPQQRLRGAEERSCRVQQRRVRVTKPMPVHSGKPERLTGRRQLTVQQVSSAPHRSASRAEDQPIGIHRIREAVRDNLDGQGVGCVALANTNHWMRGGSYGWQAAEAGAIGICWTNTMPNLPPWGSADPLLGNNPLVIAVPRPGGHVVVDMAMSQFSYGVLEQYRMRGELLPVDGGFDRQGRPTRDPAEIEASGRMLPMGYWKGSGLALVLDLMAGFLSGGQFTRNIALGSEKESGLSQVFIAFDVARLDPHGVAARMAEEVVQSVSTKARATGEPVRYPGERVLQVRNENMARGIPVEPAIWESVRAM
jgi:3-dehydro-L-gulonate 2-dehydrogenase